jgi:hypothetical protein
VTYHFRQVAPRRRPDGTCLAVADLVPRPVTAYVITAPDRPPRVYVYGI